MLQGVRRPRWHEPFAQEKQVRQRERRVGSGRVLDEAAVAHLLEPPQPLHHQESVLDERAHPPPMPAAQSRVRKNAS